MKRATFYLFLFLSTILYSQDVSEEFISRTLGVWQPSNLIYDRTSAAIFSWGYEEFDIYASLTFDWVFGNPEEPFLLVYAGSPYKIDREYEIVPNTYIVYLSSLNPNDSGSEDSIVFIHIETSNCLWVESFSDFSARTGYTDDSYEFSLGDLNIDLDLEKQFYGDFIRRYRHPIDLYSGHVYAIANHISIRLRSEPKVHGPGIGFIQQGQEVQVLEISDHMDEIGEKVDNWYRVRTSDGTEAWIYGSFLDFPESAYVWYEEDGNK